MKTESECWALYRKLEGRKEPVFCVFAEHTPLEFTFYDTLDISRASLYSSMNMAEGIRSFLEEDRNVKYRLIKVTKTLEVNDLHLP